jgi:hypothetical protein
MTTTPPWTTGATVTGHAFFPGLISGPFHHGLAIVFTFALIMCLIAAAASWLRGSNSPHAAAAAPGGTDTAAIGEPASTTGPAAFVSGMGPNLASRLT